MNKFIKIITGIALAMTLSIAAAQVTGGGVQVTCVRYNQDGSCAQTSVSGNIQTNNGGGTANPNPNQGQAGGAVQGQAGGTPTCQNGYRLVNVNGQPMCQPISGGAQGGQMQGNPAYMQGQNQRQIGSQQVDLGFVASIIQQLKTIVSWLPQLLLGVAVVVFFFYLIRYVIAGKADPKEKTTAMKAMIWALVAIFIMVTLWGIIAFFGDAVGVNPNVQVSAPSLPQ